MRGDLFTDCCRGGVSSVVEGVGMSSAPQDRWTESRVADYVEKLFPSPAFAYLRQLRNGTGFKRKTVRTADAFAVSCYPSRGLYFVGIEIKVSVADWRKELATPEKSEDLQRFCRHWYVAAPVGVVNVGEVPDAWGLIECNRSAKITKPAPPLNPVPPDMLLICSLLRNVAETSVNRSLIKHLVDKQSAEKIAAETKMMEYELTQCRAMIAKFEATSGVSLAQEWNAGNIGDAVRAALSVDPNRAIRVARRILREIDFAGTTLRRMMDEIGEQITDTDED